MTKSKAKVKSNPKPDTVYCIMCSNESTLLNYINCFCKFSVSVKDKRRGKILKRPQNVNFLEFYPVSIGVQFLKYND